MNRKDLPPVSKSLRRTKWILFALLVLIPLALLTQSQSAQKRAVREEEKSAAEARRKARRAGEEEGGNKADEAEERRRLAARPRAFRQSGLSPEPVSAQAVGFAVSRPLAEVARQTSKVPRRKVRVDEQVEEEEHEAAKNEV